MTGEHPPGAPPSAQDLVAALRGDDADARGRALAHLLVGRQWVLVAIGVNGAVETLGSAPSADLFVVLLGLCQQLGKGCGLDLRWVPDGQRPQLAVARALPPVGARPAGKPR